MKSKDPFSNLDVESPGLLKRPCFFASAVGKTWNSDEILQSEHSWEKKMKQKKEWTTMVFMAGDNNLSIDMAYALEKLRAEAALGLSEKANLLVYYKNNTGETPPVYCDFTDLDNPVYRFENEVIENANGAAKPGGVESLVGFVDWCINRTGEPDGANAGRKADKYALILAGHTLGFLSFGMFEDETTNKTMTIPTLAEGLKTIKETITGKKLSVLGFDSCVMSMIEIAHQFKDVAETMIASEGGVPNAGWSYPGTLTTLAGSAQKLDAKSIVKECTVSYIEQQSRLPANPITRMPFNTAIGFTLTFDVKMKNRPIYQASAYRARHTFGRRFPRSCPRSCRCTGSGATSRHRRMQTGPRRSFQSGVRR